MYYLFIIYLFFFFVVSCFVLVFVFSEYTTKSHIVYKNKTCSSFLTALDSDPVNTLQIV